MRRASRADDSNGVLIALGDLAPDIKDNRRRVNFSKRFRIGPGLLSNNGRAKIAYPFQLGGKIDRRFPVRNLIGDLVANSFHLAQLAPFHRQDPLRFPENFEQLPQSHWPDRRQHVQDDASFGRIHVARVEQAFRLQPRTDKPEARAILKWDLVLVRLRLGGRFRRWSGPARWSIFIAGLRRRAAAAPTTAP